MKTIITILFILCTTGYLSAQTSAVKTGSIATESVPEAVKSTFKYEFPSIQPKWEIDNKNYKAIYSDPKTNSKGVIVYDLEGKVIRRDVETNSPPEKK